MRNFIYRDISAQVSEEVKGCALVEILIWMFENSEKKWNIKPRTFGSPEAHVPHPCLPSAIPCKFHTTFQHSTFILKTSYIYACITMKHK